MPDKPRRRKKRSLFHNITPAHKVIYAIYVFLVLVVFVNLVFPSQAFPIVSLNWYSSESYPPQTLTIPPGPPTSIFSPVSAVLNVTVSASQPFAEGVPITIHVVGCEEASTNSATKNVTWTDFTVGFYGAYDEMNPNSGNTFNGRQVLAQSLITYVGYAWPNNCPVNILGRNAVHFGEVQDSGVVFFKNPGTYPIVIRGTYWANESIASYTYPMNTITVQSSDSVNQGVRLFADGVAGATGFAFAITDGRKVADLMQGRPSQNIGESVRDQTGRLRHRQTVGPPDRE